MIYHYEEEKFLSEVEIERYWLHYEDFETNVGETVDYFKDEYDARASLVECIVENPYVHYFLCDLETGEEIVSYDPND